MYSPLLFTTICHLSINFSIPHFKNSVGFKVMNVTTAFLGSSVFAKFLEFNNFADLGKGDSLTKLAGE
jgi:hypothetical protein